MGLIEQSERAQRWRYDWVVRTRPDAHWFLPHPPACALRPATIHAHVWNDHHFVLPRSVAAVVMRGTLDAYTQCAQGPFPHATLERWLHISMNNAKRALPTRMCSSSPTTPAGAARYGQLVFPFALARTAERTSRTPGCSALRTTLCRMPTSRRTPAPATRRNARCARCTRPCWRALGGSIRTRVSRAPTTRCTSCSRCEASKARHRLARIGCGARSRPERQDNSDRPWRGPGCGHVLIP